MDINTVKCELYKEGFQTNLGGFVYLAEAICIADELGSPFFVMKEVYPRVAAKYNTSPQTVEARIRYSIKRAGVELPNNQFISLFILRQLLK